MIGDRTNELESCDEDTKIEIRQCSDEDLDRVP